ncbi:hypothetical protein NDU88_002163 [Pleurodeles waltl]|uniref:Uncharacterized protein n=1 Tax=Pleurodeles waltl TaxID=8319 RepID=A0AAV7WQV2_PLEWA|nr:hypothetical protein NDU88_002163 [Pleurodeles waltl]
MQPGSRQVKSMRCPRSVKREARRQQCRRKRRRETMVLTSAEHSAISTVASPSAAVAFLDPDSRIPAFPHWSLALSLVGHSSPGSGRVQEPRRLQALTAWAIAEAGD